MRGDRFRTSHFDAGMALARRAKVACDSGRPEEGLALYRQAVMHLNESSASQAAKYRTQVNEAIAYLEGRPVVPAPVEPAKPEPTEADAAELLDAIRLSHSECWDVDAETRAAGGGRG